MQNEKASDWFIKGKYDLEDAELLLNGGGHTSTIAVLIQQAVEKYLKGYLVAHGWKLKKTHDIEELVTSAAKYDKSFTEFLEFARIITAYYVEDRYPPGPLEEYSQEEILGSLNKAKEIIGKIEKKF